MPTIKPNLYAPDMPGQRSTWILAVPILVVVFFILGQLLVLLPGKHLEWFSRETIETYPHILYLILGSFTAVAAIFVLWITLFERRDLKSVGLGRDEKSLFYYLRGLVLGLLMAASVVYAVRLLGGYSVEANVDLQLIDLAPIAILLFAFVLQSATEEMVFRGWMMARIAARYGIWAGVIGNSIVFTLMHVEFDRGAELGVIGVVLFTSTTFVFSLFLSFLAIRENSIWGASAWHAAWNWMFITCFGLPTTGIELNLKPLLADYMPTPGEATWLTGGIDGPEGSVFTSVVLCIGCVVLIWRRSTCIKM